MSLHEELIAFINKSPTMFNTVDTMKNILLSAGFLELRDTEKWRLRKGGKYFYTAFSSSIIAFTVGAGDLERSGFRIISSHTDSPMFRIKSNPVMKRGSQHSLNIEPYGGMIVNTWYDRPLGMAGRVVLRGKNPFSPVDRIVNIKEPLFIIPNLAIHMNRDINNGYAYNNQVDSLPLILDTYENIDSDYIEKILIEDLRIQRAEDILDFELYLYEVEGGRLVGRNEGYISSSRLDNLASVHSSLMALLGSIDDEGLSSYLNKGWGQTQESGGSTLRSFGIDSVPNTPDEEVYTGFDGIRMVAAFNNEEIGSMTPEGADSNLMMRVLERISIGLGKSQEELYQALSRSFMVSADLAHSIHPNKPEVADPTNKPAMGKGPCVKVHSGRAYASDAYSVGIFKDIAQRAEIPVQYFVNRSDKRSGSTIGSILSSKLNIPTVDVGIPILAMHSIRELASVEDYNNYCRIFMEFFY